MGLFFYNKIGSIISIGDLPTTNIIEPIKKLKYDSVFEFLLFKKTVKSAKNQTSLSFSYDLKFFKRVWAFSKLKVFSAIKLSTSLGTSFSVAPAKSARDFA